MKVSPRRGNVGLLAGALALTMAMAGCTKGKESPQPTATGSTGSQGIVRLLVERAPFRLASPLQREVAVLANDTIYVAGGVNAAEHSVNSVFTLNPASGQVASVGAVPRPFHDAAGAVIGRRLVVFGGGSVASTDTVQAVELDSGRGSVVSRLPKPLSDISSAVVGSTVYLVGGYQTAPQAAIYATTDGLRFRVAGRLPKGLRYTAVASVGTEVVVAGGISAAGPVRDVYLFDPATAKVTFIGRLPTAVGHASAFTLGGTVFVAGGLDARGHAVRQLVAVDPGTRRIAPLAPLPAAFSDAAAVSDGTTTWLIGGWNGKTLAQVLTLKLERTPA